MAWGYWPGCYRPQVGLGVQAWLLEAPGWPGGTGLAASGPMLAFMVLARLLQAPGWRRGEGLAAAAHRWYWPGCYSLRDSLGLLVWLLQAPGWPEGYWPSCFWPTIGLMGTGLAATGRRLA